jgi:hypothetical protein
LGVSVIGIRVFLYLAIAAVAYFSARLDRGFLAHGPAWLLAGIAAETFFSVDAPQRIFRSTPSQDDSRSRIRSTNVVLFILAGAAAILTRTVDPTHAPLLTWLVIGWASSIFFSFLTESIISAAGRVASESVRSRRISSIDLAFERQYMYECLVTTALCILVCLLAGRRLTDWEMRQEALHGKYSSATLLPLLFILILWFVVPVLAGVGAAATFQSARRVVDRADKSRPIYSVVGVITFAAITTVMYLTVYGSFVSELDHLRQG